MSDTDVSTPGVWEGPAKSEPDLNSLIDGRTLIDGKVPCPKCGNRYVAGPGLGVHMNAAHSGSPRTRRKACSECGKMLNSKDMARHRRDIHGLEPPKIGRPPKPKPEPEPITAVEISTAAAALIWPDGVPSDKLQALMAWHQHTLEFLSAVQEQA